MKIDINIFISSIIDFLLFPLTAIPQTTILPLIFRPYLITYLHHVDDGSCSIIFADEVLNLIQQKESTLILLVVEPHKGEEKEKLKWDFGEKLYGLNELNDGVDCPINSPEFNFFPF